MNAQNQNEIVELSAAETEQVEGGWNAMNLVGFGLYLATGEVYKYYY